MTEINRVIWQYWEGPLPDYLALCMETVKAHAGDAEVRVLDREGFSQLFKHDQDIDLDRLTPVQRSDFIRAYLLREHGGLYFDVDCIVMQPLEPVFKAAEKTGFAVVHQDDGEIQTNFIVSPAHGPVVSELYKGICETLRSGKKLTWLDLATVPLVPAVEAHSETVTYLSTDLICPIHWSEPEKFAAETTDDNHKKNLNQNSLCYMMSNDTIKSRDQVSFLRSLSKDEIIAGDYFMSFLFRHSLSVEKPNNAINYKNNPSAPKFKGGM